jgi:citrate synthase
MPEPLQVDRGLEHVVVGSSGITLVAGETGGLVYRGFSIDALIGKASYEGVVHLLLQGDPPSPSELAGLRADLARRRAIAPALAHLVPALPPKVPPLDGLRTLLSAAGNGRATYPPTLDQGYDLIAQAPTLLAQLVRHQAGQAPVPPRPELGHAANFLYMLRGTPPEERQARALEDYFILLADHGMNASTFALRTVLSTQADLLSGVVAALAALKGPLHGGAPAKVSDMLDAVGDPAAAEAWVRAALGRRERLMGFGHRAYKTEDPRAVLLRQIAERVADPDRLALALAVERAALAALRAAKPGQRLFTNVEFYGAVVLEGCGLPRSLFTPAFALARTVGWTAHALEQAADNRLIRPDIHYTGAPAGREWPAGVA